MLACVFFMAVWFDATQPALGGDQIYLLLGVYCAFAIALTAVIWNNWWNDARLAGPAHVLDVLLFTVLVFSTAGYTSPFFIFFIFILFSAAIRWGWRETALTAAALVILYSAAGIMVAVRPETDFDLQRFLVRGGQLLILSGMLVWFGMHQRRSSWAVLVANMPQPPSDEPLLHGVLSEAADCAAARCAWLVWRGFDEAERASFRFEQRVLSVNDRFDWPLSNDDRQPFLFDLDTDRALFRVANGQPEFAKASDVLEVACARSLGLRNGLAIPLASDSGKGVLFLERIDGLSIDHLEFAEILASEIASRLRRHDLFQAVEATAEARARLGLARDLHDSIVQFLAGAAFRIEALMRRSQSGEDVSDDLRVIKTLMLEEQLDLRAFIDALRRGREVKFESLVAELDVLAEKLAKQWRIDCRFSSDAEHRSVPARILIDAQQLVRESVANAVRHGQASTVNIALSTVEDRLRLQLDDDGRGLTKATDGQVNQPWSLKERVRDAGGELDMESMDRGTRLTIMLPIGKAA